MNSKPVYHLWIQKCPGNTVNRIHAILKNFLNSHSGFKHGHSRYENALVIFSYEPLLLQNLH
jgi:hypothetical protein